MYVDTLTQSQETSQTTTHEQTRPVPTRFYSPGYEPVDELRTALKEGVVGHDAQLKMWLDETEVQYYFF